MAPYYNMAHSMAPYMAHSIVLTNTLHLSISGAEDPGCVATLVAPLAHYYLSMDTVATYTGFVHLSFRGQKTSLMTELGKYVQGKQSSLC
jgi:hypothetical protein